MKYYSDYNDLQEALAKVDRYGAITFTSAKTGNLILEDSQVEMYNKIQKLLNCDAMESAHGYLYNLDPEELTEAEANKVNNLWKLGCEKGYVEDFTEDEDADETKKDVDECDAVQVQTSNLTLATPAQQQVAADALRAMKVQQNAFTVLYSAMRDGNIKTGEAYSNAINPRSAKADVLSQLERAGYSNINILAIECGDPDCCGTNCTNTYVKQADVASVATEPTIDAIPDYAADNGIAFEADDENVDEDDILQNRTHNNHVDEADDKKENDAEADKEDAEADKEDADKEDAEADKKEEKSEKAEEPDEKLKDDADTEEKTDDAEDDDKLDAAEKTALKDSYKKAFKAAMLKCKFEDRAFDDLNLDEKVTFFTELSKAWNKADPSKFMDAKELSQLEKITVKK